jgi:hypothetical protein
MASLARTNGVPSDQPQGAYYTVDIAQSGLLAGTGDNFGGGVNPKTTGESINGTKPTTLVLNQRLARGTLRYKKMLDLLQTRSNVKVINLVTTGDASGDTQITDLNFGLVFENDDYIPAIGTDIASSAYTTKVLWIKDQIGTAMNTSFTENMQVYDPTGTPDKGINTESITADKCHGTPSTIVSAITVAEVAGFRSNVASEVAGDNASLHTNDTE